MRLKLEINSKEHLNKKPFLSEGLLLNYVRRVLVLYASYIYGNQPNRLLSSVPTVTSTLSIPFRGKEDQKA